MLKNPEGESLEFFVKIDYGNNFILKVFMAIVVVVFCIGVQVGWKLKGSKRLKKMMRSIQTQSQTTYKFDHEAPRFQPLGSGFHGAWPQ